MNTHMGNNKSVKEDPISLLISEIETKDRKRLDCLKKKSDMLSQFRSKTIKVPVTLDVEITFAYDGFSLITDARGTQTDIGEMIDDLIADDMGFGRKNYREIAACISRVLKGKEVKDFVKSKREEGKAFERQAFDMIKENAKRIGIKDKKALEEVYCRLFGY
jgi:hypothetical protein